MKTPLCAVGGVVFSAALLGLAASAESTKPQPLTEADVLKLVELQMKDQAVIDRLRDGGGVDFKVDDEVIAHLRKAGASERVLAALRGKDAPPDKPAGNVIAAGRHDSGAVLELTELKRTSDGFLQVSFHYRNPTDKPLKAYHGQFVVTGDTDITGDAFAEIYYVEPNQKVKHRVASDDSGKLLSSTVRPRLPRPGERRRPDLLGQDGQPQATASTRSHFTSLKWRRLRTCRSRRPKSNEEGSATPPAAQGTRPGRPLRRGKSQCRSCIPARRATGGRRRKLPNRRRLARLAA